MVRALVTAILAGQHSLLLGPPETAKGELARKLACRIDGAQYGEILISKSTARRVPADPRRESGSDMHAVQARSRRDP
jgi:MoxR-like ATPase